MTVRAFLVTGLSGSGKTTTAAALDREVLDERIEKLRAAEAMLGEGRA